MPTARLDKCPASPILRASEGNESVYAYSEEEKIINNRSWEVLKTAKCLTSEYLELSGKVKLPF